jgi:hypothetical protein
MQQRPAKVYTTHREVDCETVTWSEFLPMSMPIVATVAVDLSAMALFLRNPVQRHKLAVQEHAPTIPLPDFAT